MALQWVTESELDNLGFILQRATAENGDYREIANYRDNEALKGAGTTSRQTVYVFNDHGVFNGQTYWYKLIDVDMNGVRTEHKVISATPFSSVVVCKTILSGPLTVNKTKGTL